VSTQPGLMALHEMPWGAPSSATQRVRPSPNPKITQAAKR
jgi:hypothetical protein